MTNRYGLAFLSVDFHLDNSREILPEVIDQAAAHFFQKHGVKPLSANHRQTDLGGNIRMNGDGFTRCPMPVGLLQIHPGIVGFAVVEVCQLYRAIQGYLPAFVGADTLHRTIGVSQPQLQQQGLAIRCDAVGPGEHKAAHRPAAGHLRCEGVLRLNQLRNVIALVLQVMLVRGEAGGKILSAHLFSVEGQLIYSQRRCQNLGMGNCFFRFKGFAEGHDSGGYLFLFENVFPVGNPSGLPGGIQAAGSEGEAGAVVFRFIFDG